MREKLMDMMRVVVAVLPLLIVSYASVSHAEQSRTLEDRMMAMEIQSGRMDERYHAIIARLDSQEKTLWWLMLATFGSSGVSGAVAVDRVRHKRKEDR